MIRGTSDPKSSCLIEFCQTLDLVAIALFRIVLRVASFRITEVIRDRKQDVEATDQCSSLTSGHQDPEVARYGITMTKVARKYEERKAENSRKLSQRPSLPLGSLWPTFLTLSSSTGHLIIIMILPVCKGSQIYDRPLMEILLFLHHGQFAWVHGALLSLAQHYGQWN